MCRGQQDQSLTLNYDRALKKNARVRKEGWEKPRDCYTKLNVDAAFSVKSFLGASGALIHDHPGNFIAGSSNGIPHVDDATTAEARVLRDGLSLAGQTGCSKIEVNSDCMNVIEVMQQEGNSIGPVAAIYEECAFLSRGFAHVIYSYSPRDSNCVAHCLASRAEGSQSVVWHEDPPDFIVGLLANDVNLFVN
jgi:hypothetical protein